MIHYKFFSKYLGINEKIVFDRVERFYKIKKPKKIKLGPRKVEGPL